MIDKNLHQYLQTQWRFCNHTKYLKYFDDWVKNITDNQIYYFTKEMNHDS